jgi:hypothetical protein
MSLIREYLSLLRPRVPGTPLSGGVYTHQILAKKRKNPYNYPSRNTAAGRAQHAGPVAGPAKTHPSQKAGRQTSDR